MTCYDLFIIYFNRDFRKFRKTCNKLININRKACSNIPEAIINLLYQPAWAILVKLGEINMIPQSYYSKQNSKFYHRVKF